MLMMDGMPLVNAGRNVRVRINEKDALRQADKLR
jgi:hypothetical protein